MILDSILNSVIIILFIYVARLSYSYYASSVKNHYRYRVLYSIGFLLAFQAVLAFNYIWFRDVEYQSVRWLIFYITEVLYVSMLLKNTSLHRRHELSITSLFLVVVLLSTVHYNMLLECVKIFILIFLGLKSNEPLIRRYYTLSMAIYGVALLLPTITGLTGTESLSIGVVYAISFVYASKKIYDKEKVDDHLRDMVLDEMLNEEDKNELIK